MALSLLSSIVFSLVTLADGASLACGERSLGVTVLGSPEDSRVAAIREAVAFWNRELEEIGAHVQLGPIGFVEDSIPDPILRDLSGAVLGGGWARGLSRWTDEVPGDIAIVLSHADLISFAIPGHGRTKGLVVLRRADVPPLSLPNVARNAVAHELGHVLGLDHNSDPSTLMCGRPATCRPTAFASDGARFFPLTPSETRELRENWP